MVLTLSPSSKGEVAVGLCDRVCIIVDDNFRMHHVFYMKKILPLAEIKLTSEKSPLQELSVQMVKFSKSANLVAALVSERYLVVWRRQFGSEDVHDSWSVILTLGRLEKAIIDIMVSSDDQSVLLMSRSNKILRCDLNTRKVTTVFDNVCIVLCMDMSNCGGYFVSGDCEGRIRVNNHLINYQIEAFCLGHSGLVSALLFTSTFVVSGSADGKVMLWDFKTGKCVSSIDVFQIIGISGTYVQALLLHYREKRIMVIVQGTSKVLWFDFKKGGSVKKTFSFELPIKHNIIDACWDYHGVFWVGVDDPECPVLMFFVDPEMAKIFEVDVEQDHRLKALSKHAYRNIETSLSSRFLDSYRHPILSNALKANGHLKPN